MATFPSLGIIISSGYQENHESSVIRTPMEGGPYKQALYSGKQTIVRAISYWFNATEYPQFVQWFRQDIARGADDFFWTDPVDNTLKVARIVNGTMRVTPTQPLNRYTVEFELETYE